MRLKRFLALDWDAIAGVIAAVAAIVLHFLHIIDVEVLNTLTVVLIALLFIRDLRRERITEQIHKGIEWNEAALRSIQTSMIPPDAILIGPSHLSAASQQFTSQAQGTTTWFHVCLSMFKPQSLFDILLKPAIENPQVTSIQFILDESQKNLWETEVVPKIKICRGAEKVRLPQWANINEPVSLIVAETGMSGKTECLMSFWGEPFMAQTVGRNVPRYIFHIQGHSELVSRLVELERQYRLHTQKSDSS
jgi:hypothetical protein